MTIEAELHDGTILEFPDGTDQAVIQSAVQNQLSAQPAVPSPQTGIGAQVEKFAAGPLEFISGVNRSAIELIDFLGPDQINNILELSGSDKRVPTLGGTEFAQQATTGGFLEEGLARDIVRSAGEVAGAVVAPQQAVRTVAQQLPKIVSAAERTLPGIIRQAGSQTVPQAAISGAAVGAGAEVGGEVGEAVAGEEGRQVGEFVGGVLAPIAPSVAVNTAKRLVTPSAKKFLKESVPTIEGLKKAAREVYKEIDDLGATILPGRVTRLSNELEGLARREGFNARIHPKVSAVLDEFGKVKGTKQTTTNIDTLRKVAQSSANSIEPDEKRLGVLLINKIDDFMDGLGAADLAKGKGKGIGEKYKDARQLWGRARKSEQLEDAFERARNQASGFENGIRTQFRSILNSKKKSRGFTAEELSAMKQVVRGGPAENIAKALGKFGFTEGQATNMMLGSLGVAGGAAIGGAPLAVAVPLVGQISRNLAQKLTRGNAEFANQIVKAGKNGQEVVKAYLRNTPAKERNSAELTELLLRPEVSLAGLETQAKKLGPNSKKLVNDAAFFINFIRSQEQQ